MNVEEWQKRLEKTFGNDAVVGPALLPIIDAETRYGGSLMAELHGFLALSSSFQSFYVETFHAIERENAPKAMQCYWPLIFMHISTLRVFRSAEILLFKGYPLVG